MKRNSSKTRLLKRANGLVEIRIEPLMNSPWSCSCEQKVVAAACWALKKLRGKSSLRLAFTTKVVPRQRRP